MTLSNAMSIWSQLHQAAPDALNMVRWAGEWVTFYEDAERLSAHAGVPLSTWQMAKVALIPLHTLASYRAVMMRHGITIATGEQLELPGVEAPTKPAQLIMF